MLCYIIRIIYAYPRLHTQTWMTVRLAPWSTVAELAQMWENWDENELEEVQW